MVQSGPRPAALPRGSSQRSGTPAHLRSGVPLTNDEPKYAQADVATKVLAILG